MNRWYHIRRLRGAVVLILIGVLALLNQWHILRWGSSWPLFLIGLGLLLLVERAAWTADVRAQQEAQEDAAGATYGHGQPPGAAAGSAGWPSASASSNVGSGPFVQVHPPTPEDPGREGR
jgi:LiaI-LiaF-like transmembrane region